MPAVPSVVGGFPARRDPGGSVRTLDNATGLVPGQEDVGDRPKLAKEGLETFVVRLDRQLLLRGRYQRGVHGDHVRTPCEHQTKWTGAVVGPITAELPSLAAYNVDRPRVVVDHGGRVKRRATAHTGLVRRQLCTWCAGPASEGPRKRRSVTRQGDPALPPGLCSAAPQPRGPPSAP